MTNLLIFGTGRGKKEHMVDFKTMDNTYKSAVCGVNIDNVLDVRFVDADRFCGNCKRTAAYKNIS